MFVEGGPHPWGLAQAGSGVGGLYLECSVTWLSVPSGPFQCAMTGSSDMPRMIPTVSFQNSFPAPTSLLPGPPPSRCQGSQASGHFNSLNIVTECLVPCVHFLSGIYPLEVGTREYSLMLAFGNGSPKRVLVWGGEGAFYPHIQIFMALKPVMLVTSPG